MSNNQSTAPNPPQEKTFFTWQDSIDYRITWYRDHRSSDFNDENEFEELAREGYAMQQEDRRNMDPWTFEMLSDDGAPERSDGVNPGRPSGKKRKRVSDADDERSKVTIPDADVAEETSTGKK